MIYKKSKEEHEKKEEKKRQSEIPDELYCLVAVGAVSTFLPSAIIGGYLLDTTPLLDSKELEHAMNQLTSLRNKAIDILKIALHVPKNKDIVLRRWFASNRDVHLLFNQSFIDDFEASFFKSMKLVKQRIAVDPSYFTKPILLNTPIEILSQVEWPTETKSEHNDTAADHKEFDDWKIDSLPHLLTGLCCSLFNALGYISVNGLLPFAVVFKDVKQFRFEVCVARKSCSFHIIVVIFFFFNLS
ncbi:hypothetical protein RFI_24557 [Reticulomyxa filosa]|uniref:Post-transcriptional regulator MKT1 N-terminal domain-containing protein n=1 Tax=Reticulomyxa filosa TaxID=46433 RepID=X6MGP6_RETFI|nr:hypothetical protein RFI_24557 [Reticulomyxa filosa]|eukprot:ETO12821.1 hypothetical protein RFI_24557 [Reticulomyxa filosa]